MAEAWEQQPGEPHVFFARFNEFYLTGGENRTVAKAYRAYRAKQAASSGKVGDFSKTPPAGGWVKACADWRWVSRAQAWDAHQAVLTAKAHANAVRKANEKHLAIVQNHFGKLIKQTTSIDYSMYVDMGDLLKFAKELINLERLLLGMPLQVEEVRRAPSDPLITQAIKESASTASCATPELLAEVCKILAEQGALGSAEEPEREPEARSA